MVDFIQQGPKKKMHVTSNPFFAFHDDVFPAFSKNSVSQPRFPKPAAAFFNIHQKTIIPNSPFTSLQEFKHISTLYVNLNESESFMFRIKVITF